MRHFSIHLLLALFILTFSVPVFASHNSSQDDYWLGSLRTSHLDDNPVDELPVPVLFGVTYEDINPDFGDSRGGGTRFHEGEDFIAPKGTPIVSPTEAVVVHTGEGSSAGLFVVTVGPGDEIFRYMHLDEIANIERGDRLDVGDMIGTVGDTGNAPDDVYHLHFEVRDEDNEPMDPYPRLTDEFTVKEKMSFLRDVFKNVRNDEEYAEFLVSTFTDDFRIALEKNYSLPDDIEDAIEELGVDAEIEAQASLETVMKTIPQVVTTDLENGDEGPMVALMQIYLIYMTEGQARDNLAAAGPTGYFGVITEAALLEYQIAADIDTTGIYDRATRARMRE